MQYEQSVRGPVGQMLRLAASGRVGRPRQAKPFPFQAEAPGFSRYLDKERGLRPATVAHYAHGLGRFSEYLDRVGAALGAASPALVASFAIDIAPRLSASSRMNVCGAVRVFLRYCHREGILAADLSGAVELPRSYKLSALPRSISWDDVRRMLSAVDRRSATGRRDYAILVLLVTYGLRAGEVTRLRLEDIDFKHDRLQVPERKAGHCMAYPLAAPVAEALVEYIRRVFFRVLAPCKPLGRAAVTGLVQRYLHLAGVRVHRPGAHTLRHACVQRLVDAKFPFKAIGDYVGHRSPDVTAAYAKVDLGALREVALGDGEEL